jgi:hypothetical protein
MLNLKDFASQLVAQSPVMEGREKGDTKTLLNINTTVNDFDFLKGDNGDYVVFTVNEDSKHFFFGGSVLTGHMKDLESAGYKESIQKEGLPIKLEEKKSKQGRIYTNVVFYPAE